MPFADPSQRKAYNRSYGREYAQQRVQDKPPGVCSVGTCNNKTDGVHKKCAHHLQYMRDYKEQYRAQPKPKGQCSVADCTNEARPGLKMCERCAARGAVSQKKRYPQISQRAQQIKTEVMAAYGGACQCCGERQLEFLTIDHIDGREDRKHMGVGLYRWLKANNYPEGFRALCMTCNYTLGHHGYCPHSNLTQVVRTGRPRVHPVTDMEKAAQLKEQHRQDWLKFKFEVLNAYGGPRCCCCGEDHVECLSIDHVNGNGAQHRRDNGYGTNLYIWLRQQGYPPGFRVLCVNCNFVLGRFGYCPHDKLTDTNIS